MLEFRPPGCPDNPWDIYTLFPTQSYLFLHRKKVKTLYYKRHVIYIHRIFVRRVICKEIVTYVCSNNTSSPFLLIIIPIYSNEDVLCISIIIGKYKLLCSMQNNISSKF